jgi:hypothetical protein
MLHGYRGSSRLPFANSVAELHLILPKQAVFANNSASDTGRVNIEASAEAMEQAMAVRNFGTLFGVPRIVSTVALCGHSG